MDQFLEYIAASRARILKKRQRLDAELAELDNAEKLYRASGAAVTKSQEQPDNPWESGLPLPSVRHRERPEGALADGTIKDRVVTLLGNTPDGLTSTQILNALRASGMPTLQRTSLSPQLSRLRHAGEVDLRNGVWVKTGKAEPEDAGTSSGSISPA